MFKINYIGISNVVMLVESTEHTNIFQADKLMIV